VSDGGSALILLVSALLVTSCTESPSERREREALAYGAALIQAIHGAPSTDTVFVRPNLREWPVEDITPVVRGMFRDSPLFHEVPDALAKRTALAMAQRGALDVIPRVPGRVVKVAAIDPGVTKPNYLLSPIAFTAQRDSGVVYVEGFMHGRTFISMLVLVGREANGGWTPLDVIWGAVTARVRERDALAVLSHESLQRNSGR
jgi:hypothetical protein